MLLIGYGRHIFDKTILHIDQCEDIAMAKMARSLAVQTALGYGWHCYSSVLHNLFSPSLNNVCQIIIKRFLGLFSALSSSYCNIRVLAFLSCGFEVIHDLQLIVRGTAEGLKGKPLTVLSCCPTPPIRWSESTSQNLVDCARASIPVEFISMPLAGLVAPISVLGCVIQHTAETLSGIVISQATAPGAPIIYGGSPGVLDMRSMAPCICAVEAQMIDCACVEIGKHLGLPTQAYIGLSDSKGLDAQAGFESGTGLFLAALAGINSVSGPGMHYFESCQSPEKTVFDAELCRMARRLAAGIEVRDDFPAGPLFDQLIREQNLLTAEHTLKYFRLEHCVPGPVIDRTQVNAAVASPPTLWERAHAEVERHLASYKPPDILSAEQARDLERVMRAAAGEFPVAF